MKGVILAGGLGRRLSPMTDVVNKHLLDVYDEPMVYYPIKTLRDAGVTDLVLVTGDQISQFKALLGDGKKLGVHIAYCYQEGELGIADALLKTEAIVGKDKTVVILGDNIYEDSLKPYVEAFQRQHYGARILLKEAENDEEARRFGVALMDSHDSLLQIIEKPQTLISKYIVTGVYMYDFNVFKYIRELKPSARGELEVTDLNNKYISLGKMSYDVLDGWWTDAGTPSSKLRASLLVAKSKGLVDI